jgi:hypothetical protein
MKDDIIQEVWKAKDTVAARYNHDVKLLVEHLRAREKASSYQVVDLHIRRDTPTTQ